MPYIIVNGTKTFLHYDGLFYLKHFESKINVVCWRCLRRDKSGEWISTKVENHGSLIIKKGEGFRFSFGHLPDPKEVGKRKNP